MTSAPRDYYERLGVAKNADQAAIKDAFRTLALKYHPDRNKAADAEERFKEIAEAYAILSDPKKRADYDARGFAGVADFNRDNLYDGINFDDLFSGLGFGGGSPFDFFFQRHRAGPARGANIEVEVPIPLARVVSGGEETVRLSRPVACPACHGTGEAGGVTPPPCETCHGTGRVTHSRRDSDEHVLIQQISTCPNCHGRGRQYTHPCPQCQGQGQVPQEEALTVKIPVGVEEGLTLRIPGKGMPSPEPGGPAGDLYAVVRTLPDERFERAGADLLRRETISAADAALGTTLKLPTLEGTASVTVPPGTQPEAVLRLKNKGLPAYGTGPRGDLYVRIGVQIPQHLSPQERRLYEQLQQLSAASRAGE